MIAVRMLRIRVESRENSRVLKNLGESLVFGWGISIYNVESSIEVEVAEAPGLSDLSVGDRVQPEWSPGNLGLSSWGCPNPILTGLGVCDLGWSCTWARDLLPS
ncbi:UNVERIFIED_CONTAM: hypothetical protein Slati_2120800 [Sesamum latifolium]|uniref:Uncharacterized protein n=1 Tax=Sesamum latifolium TaxID=2727402 RepID=A0AAW2WVM0_9LAMI